MELIELKNFINLYDENREQLNIVYGNIIEHVDNTSSWELFYFKRMILKKLQDVNQLETIITKYIPNEECYIDFEYDFFRYIVGIPIVNLSRLEIVLQNWGLLYKDKIPYEVQQYIFEKHKRTLTVALENHIKQSNEYSLIIKLFYFISLINSKKNISLEEIEKLFINSNISLDGIKEILYLLAREHNVLSPNTLTFITPMPIFQWIKSYGEINIIIDLYKYILNKDKIDYMDVLQFMNSLKDKDHSWILGDCLMSKFHNDILETLYNLQILDRTLYKNQEVYKISNIGHILCNKKLPDSWLYNSNAIKDKNLIYIPHNDNPLKILEYMMKFTLTNPGNYLMIFNINN